MADCVCLPKCPFFFDKMSDMPAMSDIFKKNYCQGDSSNCARFMVFDKMGAGSVPSNLYPNDQIQARQFLVDSGF